MVELKQWSNDHVGDCSSDGNIIVDYGAGKVEQAHPSLQVQGYHYDLTDFLTIFADNPKIRLTSCAYCHNYSRTESNPVIFLPKFDDARKQFPVFAKEDTEAFSNFLKGCLSGGNGYDLFSEFVLSPIRPSKKLLQHAREMINKRQIFNLIDDQIAPYNSIMSKAKALTRSSRKAIVIVKGGPGTGKSVIALEVMCELMRLNKPVFHATGSSAFTNTLRQIFGNRIGKLFKFFISFGKAEPDSIDVLICDEGHRIRRFSENRFTKRDQRSKVPQIDELLQAAKLSIFFIDEKQIVRPKEIGSVQLIKDAAKRFGVAESDIAEFELTTQFRCSGSDAYLRWLERVLGITDLKEAAFDDRMEFRIFSTPSEMMNEIRSRNSEKKNSARIVAGFCWPWSDPNSDGTLVNDVTIGDFAMPWEKKNAFWKWATDDSGMEQVGTVYTAQGFEFDYIGVIFANDLVYDSIPGKWRAVPGNSEDSEVKRNNPGLTEHLQNVYRVLLSRAHKGVYVYFMDPCTEQHFRKALPSFKQQHTVD